ncbi:MAG TPA: hypothetical protein VFL29_13260 [Candidatus Dormibacteraeota bacterium]|nr:hypothetical protein [Candidatus Dormibacteraeota bacterium]
MVRRLLFLCSCAALVVLALVPVNAAAKIGISISFFSGAVGPVASGSAHWTNTASNDADPFSVQIDVSDGSGAPNFFSSFGGIDFHHVPASAPATPPAFDFMADKSAASGGSPRLVIQFSDGGDMELRPLAWTATTWTHEDGSSTDWDVHSPTCPFVFETSYAAGLACHAGASVTGAFIVSDSGWLSAPYTNWIDNIQYAGTTISQPSDN